MSEQVTGTIRALITRGLRGDLHCVLVFTSERVVVAVQSMLFQIASGLGGAGGAVGAVAGQGAMKRQDIKGKLDQLSPQEILGSNKRNFQVPYTDITKVQMGKKLGTSRLYIHTPNKTYKFKFKFRKARTSRELDPELSSFFSSR